MRVASEPCSSCRTGAPAQGAPSYSELKETMDEYMRRADLSTADVNENHRRQLFRKIAELKKLVQAHEKEAGDARAMAAATAATIDKMALQLAELHGQIDKQPSAKVRRAVSEGQLRRDGFDA